MDWSRGQTIGRGSSATISVATSSWSDDVFAVKSVELSQSEFLQREQKFISSISCPHIVSYRGCDITRENNKLMYNLKMEYAPAGTLTDAIWKHGGRLDESMISCYTHQIVKGLEYLHSSGIVHCDIKGRNILLGENGAKIADLGCAKWISPVAASSDMEAIGGTPMFMAPEAARGKEQGFPADVWALGCTFIEMATGGSPWPNVNDPMSVLYQIAFSGKLPEFPDFLSQQAKDFLSRCLRTDPKERWTAKQLLHHPFLEGYNSERKQNQEFATSSPTSILDQGVWNCIEESETFGEFVQTRNINSPAKRIRGLSLNSRVPDWRLEETWVIVRANTDENDAEDSCGSVTAIFGDDMEVESSSCSVCDDELILNFLGNNVISCSKILVACTCTKHSRHKELLLFNQSQKF